MKLHPAPATHGPSPGPGDHLLRWDGATGLVDLYLTPERAVWWPAQRTLFVADMHVGKAATFRAHGLPVPQGTTTSTLKRLSGVLTRTGAERLIVLGDFLHARQGQAPATLAALQRWRDLHAELDCLIVQGNHDRHAGHPPSALRFGLHVGLLHLGGVIGAHDAGEILQAGRGPQASESLAQTPIALVGHEHPVVTLRDRLDHLRLPCYVLRGSVLTLPAFGDFTGGAPVNPREGKLFIVSDVVTPLLAC